MRGAGLRTVGVASLKFPARQKSKEVADSSEVKARIAHQAQKSRDPVVVSLGEVARAFFRLHWDEETFSFVEAEQVYGDVELASDRADLNESIRFVLLDTRPRRLHKHLVTKTISTFGIT